MAVRVFVSSDFMSSFNCPECGKSKQMDVSKFMKHRTEVKLKYKCPCKHQFSVILERRRSVRKNVILKGHILHKNIKYAITIKDISKHGLRIQMAEKPPLKIGSNLMIRFTLNNVDESVVNKDVIVRNIYSQSSIGVEFANSDHYGQFGKYLLFHFG